MSDYGETLEAQMLADLVAEGMTLVAACREIGVVYSSTFRRLAHPNNPLFAEMMEKAREAGYDAIAETCVSIADGEGDPRRDKLRVETRLKLLAKWHPKRYGEKLQVEQKTATVSIPVSDDPIEAQRAYEALMRGD